LTRRLKKYGPTWTVKEKKGRREFSRGVWAEAASVRRIKMLLASERSTPQHAKKQAAAKVKRDRDQTAYVAEFTLAVERFLAFHPRHRTLGKRIAEAVAKHATPVGSGTVARTKRISVERRAEAAVIAWMRHHTTAYDDMKIARVKGKRREVRARLARVSRQLLARYRAGGAIDEATCPLWRALDAL